MSVNPAPLILGEVLFDRFPGETPVLGGAPFNVAWHLAGLGLRPLMLSRIGADPLGEQVIQACEAWRISTCGLQRDPVRPTGRVDITLVEGEPSYTIVADQAYDAIELQPVLQLIATSPPSLFYHGSLIARSQSGRALIERLTEHLPRPRFVDINLRPPWWDVDSALTLCRGADWLKVNEEELRALSGLDEDRSLQAGIERLVEQTGVEHLLVTRGAHGALFVEGGHTLRLNREPLARVVDTVGAGDAFSAVAIYGILHGWDGERILSRADTFARRICTQRGATRADPVLYREALASWRE